MWYDLEPKDVRYNVKIWPVNQSDPVSLAQLGERQTEVSVTKSGGIVFDPRRGHRA